MSEKPVRKTGAGQPIFSEPPFALKLTWPDGLMLGLTLVYIAYATFEPFVLHEQVYPFTVLSSIHFYLSRYGLGVGAAMLLIAIYIGIIRKGDVTPWFRRGAYIVFGTMLIQALIGAYMLYVMGIQPGRPEHIIYGFGTVLSLPFFIFVEVTARKRPSMGSYIWAFTLLIGVVIRSISTGPMGQ